MGRIQRWLNQQVARHLEAQAERLADQRMADRKRYQDRLQAAHHHRILKPVFGGFKHNARLSAGVGSPGIWDYFGDVVRGVQCCFKIRSARRALERLTDHMLKISGSGVLRSAVTARGRKRNQNHTASSSLPLVR